MDGKKDFTLDEENFGDLPALVDEVKAQGLRFIIILDPAIAVDDNYTSYLNGLDSNAFVTWSNETDKPNGQDLPDDVLMGAVLFFIYRAVNLSLISCLGMAGTDRVSRLLQAIDSRLVDEGSDGFSRQAQIRRPLDSA